MANTLSVAGSTRVSWSLSDGDASSKSDSQSSSRSITTGTGPNQANVAWSETFATTGVGSVTWDISQLPVSAFGFAGLAGLTKVKELLVSVTTGPAGGYVRFGIPTGVTGVRINAGGQFHFCDYLTGLSTASGNISIANGVTGSYSGQITVIGDGAYESI
jgi:hypothetical protein